MRRFVCASCGKTIEAGWCTNQRGRDMKCRDCGGRVHRDHGNGLPGMRRQGVGRGAFAARSDVDARNTTGSGTGPEENVFNYNRGRRQPASGFCRNRGGGRGYGRGAE